MKPLIHPSERGDLSFGVVLRPADAIQCRMYPAVLVAGLALSAAGAGMQYAGAQKAKSAMNNAQTAELLRQKKYQEEADASFQANLKQSDRATAEAETQAGATRRAAEYQALDRTAAGAEAPMTATATGGANSAAGAVKRTAATVSATNNAWSRLVSDARAKLGGADDWQLSQNTRNTRTNQDLALTSSKARGSAAVLPYEMNAASQQGDSLKAWGSLVGALGSAVGMAGATAPVAAGQSAWSAVNWTPATAANIGALA
jgi:hypothetical protein